MFYQLKKVNVDTNTLYYIATINSNTGIGSWHSVDKLADKWESILTAFPLGKLSNIVSSLYNEKMGINITVSSKKFPFILEKSGIEAVHLFDKEGKNHVGFIAEAKGLNLDKFMF